MQKQEYGKDVAKSQEELQAEKYHRMTQKPIPRLVLSLAAPCILSMLITAFYNMADTYFVSKISTEATAAVGVVFSLMAIIQSMGFFFGHGSGNYISRQLGGHHADDAKEMAAVGFFSAVICGGGIMVIGLLVLQPLVVILGATPEIEADAVNYTRFILGGAPFMMGALVMNNQLRFQGSATYGMIGMCSGGLINIALDPLFIFGFDLGVAGASLATMVSQIISFTILAIMTHKGGNIPIALRYFKPTFVRYKEIARGGFPSLARQGIASIGTICVNLVAGAYGVAAIAALSVVNRVINFAASALIGFGQGFQPVCGFNYGAGLYHRVRRAFEFCVKSSIGFLAMVALVGFIFAPQIIALFREDPQVVEIGTAALRAQCITFPTFAWCTMGNMMLQTMGKAGKATILALARQGLFLIPAVWFLSWAFGITGLELSQSAADLCSFLLSVPIVLSVLRELGWRPRLRKDDTKHIPQS